MGKTKLSRTFQMKYLIQGLTNAGALFRPSDWSERLCSTLAFCGTKNPPGIRTVKYSKYIMPVLVNGVRCVTIDPKVQNIEPLAWEFALNFARDNNLVVEENYVEPRLKSVATA